MASERYGRAFEALVVHAARRACSKGPKGEVRWNEAIPGQSVMPDVWISGPSGAPQVIFLVTHSGAPSASEKKFWRNVGELAEAKLLLGPPPVAISVLFDNAIKESLGELELRLFDKYLAIPSLDAAHAAILSSVAEKVASGKSQPPDFPDLIAALGKSDSRVRRSLGWLEDLLFTSIVRPETAPHAQLWDAIRKRRLIRPKGIVPEARNTSVRRGIAKLLIAEAPEEFLRSLKVSKDAPSYLMSLGLVKKTINGLQVADGEVRSAMQFVSEDDLRKLFALYQKNPGLQAVIRPLRHAAASAVRMQHYVTANWSELVRNDGDDLYRHLQATHQGGPRLLSLGPDVYVRPGWLFLMLTALLKAHRKRRQGFGYAKLIKKLSELSDSTVTTMRRRARGLKLASPHELRAPRTIEYGLRDWFYGADRTNFTLNEFELLACAHVLAQELSSIDQDAVAELVVEASKIEASDQVENILIPYNSFQPLKELVLMATGKAGLTPRIIQYFQNPLREQAVASGMKLNVRAGATEIIQVGKTLVRWISVTDEGKDHKRKEFAGRGALLPMTWDANAAQYAGRSDVGKLVLVIDGTFEASDIDVLHRLGWDEIYYPDQIDKLVKAIV